MEKKTGLSLTAIGMLVIWHYQPESRSVYNFWSFFKNHAVLKQESVLLLFRHLQAEEISLSESIAWILDFGQEISRLRLKKL